MSRERLRDYVQDLFAGELDGQPLSRVQLCHVGINSAPLPMKTVEVPEINDTVALSVARDFEISVSAHADDGPNGLPQTYMVFAFYGDTDEKHVGASQQFRVAPVKDQTHGFLSTEPPSLEGAFAQLMRHQEVTMRTTYEAQGETFRMLRAENERLTSRVQYLEGQRHKTLQLEDRLLTKADEREIKRLEAEAGISEIEARVKRNDDIKDKLVDLIPAVTNHIAERRGKGQVIDPDGAVFSRLKGLLGSLDREQLSAVAAVLTPDQSDALAEVYEGVGASAARVVESKVN